VTIVLGRYSRVVPVSAMPVMLVDVNEAEPTAYPELVQVQYPGFVLTLTYVIDPVYADESI
jgi:hypothetical protein